MDKRIKKLINYLVDKGINFKVECKGQYIRIDKLSQCELIEVKQYLVKHPEFDFRLCNELIIEFIDAEIEDVYE